MLGVDSRPSLPFRQSGELRSAPTSALAIPRVEHLVECGRTHLEDLNEIRIETIRRIGRLGDRMSGDELQRLRVEVDRLDSAEVPERLEPVVPPLAVQLRLSPLEDTYVATDVRGRRAGREPLLARDRGEPTRTGVE